MMTDNRITELLPCPFCGGEAEILTAESMHGGNLYGVMCDCCAGRADVYDTEAEAITAWNTRAERTCRNLSGDFAVFRCSECGYFERDCACANYCPNCGARVVE